MSERVKQTEDLPKALAKGIKLVRKNPSDLDAWEGLSQVCQELDRPDEATALYAEVLEDGLAGEDLEAVGRAAADFCEEWYEDTTKVLSMLKRVLRLEASQTWAFERLTVLLTVAARWDDLLSAYDDALESAADDLRRQELLAEAAKVARDFAGKPERGSDYLKALLLLRIEDDQLATILERRLDEQQRHEDLIEIWSARLAVLSEESALNTRLQIANRQLDPLGKADEALNSLLEFLKLGGDESAACQVLEKVADQQRASVATRRAALKLLDELYDKAERYGDVVFANQRSLSLATETEDQLALLRRGMALHQQLADSASALESAAHILKLDSSDDETRLLARSLAEGLNRLDRYREALVVAADASESGDRRVELLMIAARTSEEDLGEDVEAVDLYFRVGQDDSSKDETRLFAFRRLSDLLERAERFTELLDVLERRADLEPELNGRREILGQAASLATNLSQLERALGLWSLCLEDDPGDDPALSAKIDLFEQLQQYEGLVDALANRSRLGGDAERQRADLVRAALVYAERLSDLQSAIATWRQVEERFGRVEESLDALVDLSKRSKKFEQVAQLLSDGTREATDHERKLLLLGQLGDVQRVHLEDRAAALKAYSDALTIFPRFEVAEAGLRALITEPEFAHSAGEALVDALRRAQKNEAIIELLDSRLASAPDDSFRSEALQETAALREAAGDAVQALGDLCRAFALVPDPSTEQQVLRLAEQTADYASAVAAYDAAIEGSEDDKRIGQLYWARGRIQHERLSLPDAAASSFREALQRQPLSEELALSMIRAGQQAKRFVDSAWGLVQHSCARAELTSSLATYFESEVAVHGDWEGALSGLYEALKAQEEMPDTVGHDLKKQLAIWYRDRGEDVEAAEHVLLSAVREFPRKDTLGILAELQRRAPGRALVDTLIALADVVGDELSILREAGDVALNQVQDNVLSATILQRALSAARRQFLDEGTTETESGFFASDVCAWATDHLASLSLKEKKPENAVNLLNDSAELPFLPVERVARRFRAAQIAAQAELGDRAVQLCEQVLSDEPEHEGAISLLSELHEQEGRLAELLELRRRELTYERPLERRLFLRLDQARVMGELEAAWEQRAEVLRENLGDLPGHEASVEALSTLLTDAEEYEPLASMLEEQAAAISGDQQARASELYRRAGQIADEKLEDEERLVVDFQRSAAARPSIVVVDRLAEIDRVHEQFESEVSWRRLRLALTDEISDNPEIVDERRRVVVALGQALINLEDLPSARVVLEQELIKDEAGNDARDLLASVYRQLRRWSELSRLLQDGVQFAFDDVTRRAQLKEAALVEWRQLGALEVSIPLLRGASELDPSDRENKLLLADALAAAEHYEEGAAILEALLQEFGRRRTKERAAVHEQLARIAQATGNLDEALDQAEAAAKIERTDPNILMLVGQLATEKGQLDQAEQAYRTLALIASRSSLSGEVDSSAVAESSVLFELFRIAEMRGDHDQARELMDTALEVATARPTEAMPLAESLIGIGKIQLLLDALQTSIHSGLQGSDAAQALVTRADVSEKAGMSEEALQARYRALQYTPENFDLVDATEALAERCGALESFWGFLVGLAESVSDRPKVAGELWFRIGQATRFTFENPEQSADFYERALDSGFKVKRAFLALDDVLDDHADEERVQGALTRFIESPEAVKHPDVLADALYRLAKYQFAAGSIEDGAGHLLSALEISPQEERARSILDPVVRSGSVPEKVVILYLRVCRKTADPDTLLFAFRRAAMTSTVETSVLDEAITLSRNLDDGEALRELLSRRIELAGEDETDVHFSSLLVERAALARSEQDFNLESSLLERAIPGLSGDDRFELELRLAACKADDLGLMEEGQAIYEQLLEEAPIDVRIWKPLMKLYRREGRNDRVEELLARVEESVTDDTDLEVLKMERVRLMMGQGRSEEAEAELRSTLQARPHMTEAASMLVEVLQQAGRNEELRELLESLYREARNAQNAELVANYGMSLARLLVDSDRTEAIDVLNAGLSLTKSRKDVLSFLLSLYTDEDNQSERADVMEYLLATASQDEAKDLSLQLYGLRKTLGDDYGAARALEEGVKIVPEDAQLTELFIENLRIQGEHGQLAEALMLRGAQLSGESAAALFSEAAEIFSETLGDPTRAAQASIRAYEADPADVEHLARSCHYLVAVGEVDQALERLASVVEMADSTALADALQMRASIIKRERPGDRDAMAQASQDLVSALEQFISEDQERELKQMRVDVLSELLTLHQAEDDWERERETVRQLAQLLIDTEDPHGGIDVLANYVRQHEQDPEMCLELGELALTAGDPGAAVFAYDRLVACTEGEDQTRAVLLLSDAATASGSPQDARAALEQAFARDPQNGLILDKLRETYTLLGLHADLARLLSEEAERAPDASSRAALLLQMGELYRQAGDFESAARALEEARHHSEATYQVVFQLAHVYLAQGSAAQAEQVLEDAIAEHGKRRSPELSLLQQGLAEVAQARGDMDAMFSWLEAALMSDRNNGEVASDLAIRAQDMGRYDIAVRALQSLTLSKADAPMNKAEAYLRQAQIAQIQGDTKKALLMARRAQATDDSLPGAAELVSELGG